MAHSDLTRDARVADTIVELLRGGSSGRLPALWRTRSRASARLSDAALRRTHTQKVDWPALGPEERRLYLENLNEPPRAATAGGHQPRAAYAPEKDVNNVLNELNRSIPDLPDIVRIVFRLTVALLIGTAVGLQRELAHKTAGVRTHMLVALGTALIIVTASDAGFAPTDLSRVIQGVSPGSASSAGARS